MDNLQVSDAITEIFDVLRASNKYIDETTPWVLAKDTAKEARLETVLYHLLEAIRVCAVLIEPFLPDTSKEILRQLNTSDNTTTYQETNSYELNDPQVLFQRINPQELSNHL